MFVGHGMLAFALLAAIGRVSGWHRERTLTLAVLAAVFATIPDVDMVYALVGVLDTHSSALDAASAFWQTGNVVHRVLTHSIVVAPVVALAAGLWATQQSTDAHPWRRLGPGVAIALLGGLVVLTAALSGGLAGTVMAMFAAAALVVAQVARRRGVSPAAVGAVALVALVSHPFGDVFTGEPPALLYPLDVPVIRERVLLHPDPTLHLLGAFFVELAAIWVAVAAYHDLRGYRLRKSVARRAMLGFGYAAVAFTLPAPTLDSSYQFVFTALAVGVVGPVRVSLRRVSRQGSTSANPAGWVPGRLGFSDARTAVVTGLAAVTLAALGYTLVYLLA
jgi:membrane-bound metal-dependent hydrolase YbcI (DUF457 family)